MLTMNFSKVWLYLQTRKICGGLKVMYIIVVVNELTVATTCKNVASSVKYFFKDSLKDFSFLKQSCAVGQIVKDTRNPI